MGTRIPFYKHLMSLFWNPVLYKELSIGLRDRKIFVLQTIYLTILSVAMYLIMLQALFYDYSPTSPAEAGKVIFYVLLWIQLILVVLIAPSLTCGSITTEKEKKTYELLIGTLLTPAEIISGKLIHGISYIFLLLVSSLPITATVFFLGGVSPLQIIGGYLCIFAAGFICCQIGEFFSAREQKTSNSTNQSYLLIILFAIGVLPMLGGFFSVYQGNLMHILSYKTFHFPLWLFGLINFIAIAGFLFTKSVNYLKHEARNIIFLNIFFITAYLFNLMIVSGLFAESRPDNEGLGTFFTFLLAINMFALGFFGKYPTFTSQKEYLRFKSSPLSRPYFFPTLFSLAALIPLFFFAVDDKGNLPFLLSSFYLNTFFILTFYALSRIIHKLAHEKLPFAFFYYLIFFIGSFLPFITFAKSSVDTTSGFLDFHFLSPLIVMISLWSTSNFPKVINIAGTQISLPLFSIVANLALLLAGALMLNFLCRKRKT
ncbi:MAG: ABC transporter permease [Vulcanimicrobiota bacterium]